VHRLDGVGHFAALEATDALFAASESTDGGPKRNLED